MTVLDDRQGNWLELQYLEESRSGGRPQAGVGRVAAPHPRRARSGLTGPASATRSTRPPVTNVAARPAVAPLTYRGTGIPVSRATLPRRAVSNSATLAVAFLAALITLWLGWIAHVSGGAAAGSQSVPDRLAVVRVQAGRPCSR